MVGKYRSWALSTRDELCVIHTHFKECFRFIEINQHIFTLEKEYIYAGSSRVALDGVESEATSDGL